MAHIKLYQFPASHFNEKARWALDLKGVPHQRVSLLPGPHLITLRRLYGGTQVPVLVEDGSVIPGSARILDHLERRFPEPALYPHDPADRQRALAIQDEFDEQVGPAVRLAKFFEVMSAGYATRTFCRDQPGVVRAVYRATFPVIFMVMKHRMAITPENAERARERTRAAFDFVAKQAGPGGYLIGNRFSVADLTCAALLMPAVDVGAWGGPPEAGGARVQAWLDRWRDHPGAEWVRSIYRRHRRPTPA